MKGNKSRGAIHGSFFMRLDIIEIVGSITIMKIGFVLYRKTTDEYRTPTGGWSKNINDAFLFSNKQVSQYIDQFQPNFEFPAVAEENGKKELL